ncbi:MAG: biotin-dependent carboxyltransferase family protein [Pseudomonadota bacterium]
MTLKVIRAGLQTSIQGAPRMGLRHLAVPAGGSADPLSMALANRLVDNALSAAGLEITLSGALFECDRDLAVAVTGAEAAVSVNGQAVDMHATLRLTPGDHLDIGAARSGARTYLAVAGELEVPTVLGSQSTCLSAAFGGLQGRPLRDGDVLPVRTRQPVRDLRTPEALRYVPSSAAVLRAVVNHEACNDALFDTKLAVGARADRMGVQLTRLSACGESSLASQPVFPGGIQLPPDGQPFVLGVDAQTTGGYTLLANVARVDRHCIGQLRPGNALRFSRRDPLQAREDFQQKLGLFQPWLQGAAAALR